MHTLRTGNGVAIAYKDWGPRDGRPIVFHHGWPLSSDDWDTQLLYFVQRGYRVIAHDRRGHGRSTHVNDGHDMDHYAADAAALTDYLDLRDAVHVGHSTGGGEATRYVAQYGEPRGRVAMLILINAVPPLLLRTATNPEGLPVDLFDEARAQLARNRAQFRLDLATGPFYGFNRPGAQRDDALIHGWWHQAMTGSAKAHYDGIEAFSATDFTADLKSITVPTLVMHGDDDQVVPIAISALRSVKLLRNGTLKVFQSYPHGMCATHADTINAEMLQFITDAGARHAA